MIVHPFECPACSAQVLYEFPHRRSDGRAIRFCVACGTGTVPEYAVDSSKVYGADYWLEARTYGHDIDPAVRHWRYHLWKVYLLHRWGLQLSRADKRTQIIDVGAGVSPARALTREDRERLRWLDVEPSNFARNFADLAYGNCEEPFDDPDQSLVSFIDVLDHVDNPLRLLEVHLKSKSGFALIHVARTSTAEAWAAGGDWLQLQGPYERVHFFTAKGLGRLLNRVELDAAILNTPGGLLAVADLSARSGETRCFEDWKAFAAHCGLPEHALAIYASLKGIVPVSTLSKYVDLDPVIGDIARVGEGKTLHSVVSNGAQFSYARIATEFSFARMVDELQSADALPEFARPETRIARPHGQMPLAASVGGPLRILYLGMKWDYGVPEQGWSFEHQNIYPALYYSGCVRSFLHFDYVECARRRGVGQMSRALLEVAKRYKPELVFVVFYNDEFDPTDDVLLKLSDGEHCDSTIVGFFFDDIYRFESHTRLRADVISACVTTLPPSDNNPYVQGDYSNKVIYSSCGANPLYYHRVPRGDQKYDVSLIGLPHSNRRVIVDRLKEAGISVSTFGKGWSPTSRISFSEMLDVIHSSKIVLNPSQSAHGAPGQVKGRTFEVPACGRLLLTGPMDGLSDLYNPAEEMPVFHDYADLIEKVQLFLHNERLREEVAENAWRRTLREHTWEHRLQQIFRTVAPHRQFPAPPRYDVAS